MSFVYTVWVFDSALSPDLESAISRLESVAQVQSLLSHLNAMQPGPNPKLGSLLARLNQLHPGQVSVSGGMMGLDITMSGTPLEIDGEGVDCALWALSFEPNEPEDFECALRNVARAARELKLNVFDEAMGEFRAAGGKILWAAGD